MCARANVNIITEGVLIPNGLDLLKTMANTKDNC